MSIDPTAVGAADVVSDVVAARAALRGRIEVRQNELEAEAKNVIILPVPKFEDMFAVRYRALKYRELYRIESRYDSVKDAPAKLLLVAADKLVAATEGLMSVDPDDEDTYHDLGLKWGAEAAEELFNKPIQEVPGAERDNARTALLACFPDEEAVVLHAAAYEVERKAVRATIDKVVEGE